MSVAKKITRARPVDKAKVVKKEEQPLWAPYTHGKQKRKVLVYGAPGVGKTSLVAGLDPTELGKVLILNTDHGTGRVVREGVFVTPPLKNIREVDRVFRRLAAEGPPPGVKTLFVDSLSRIIDMTAIKIDSTLADFAGIPKVSKNFWAQRNAAFMSVFHNIKDLPFDNIVFSANQTVEGSDGREGYTKPDISSSLSDKVAAYCDCVLWLEVTKLGERKLHFGAGAHHTAKCRSHIKKGTFIKLPKASEASAVLAKLLIEIC